MRKSRLRIWETDNGVTKAELAADSQIKIQSGIVYRHLKTDRLVTHQNLPMPAHRWPAF